MYIGIIKKRIFDLVGDEYKVIDTRENIKSHDKMEIVHQKCGNTLQISPNKFIDCGIRCKYCSGKVKKTTESFKQEMLDLVGDEYEVLEAYVNNETKIKFKHRPSGEIFMATPHEFLSGNVRAKEDKSRIEKKTNDFKEKVFQLVGNEYTILGPYKTCREKILIQHNTCGNTYEVTPEGFLAGRRCKYCYYNRKTKSNEDFKKQLKELVGDEYSIIGEYKNSKELLLFKHKAHTFKMRPNDFLNGHRCPLCSGKGISKPEDEIEAFLKENQILVERNKLFDKKYELDMYIPDKNIGIEYDGLYWHSDIYKEKNYHIDKTKYFNKKGIRVIHIFEDEWLNKKDIVKDKLLHILGKDSTKIFARKCIIKEINSKDRNAFLEKNHIQGKDNASISLGLFYEDKLVGVMSFIKCRISLGQKNKTNEYELSRFATSNSVVGGFSKLLKYAIKNYDIKNIITYADLRWSPFENNLYDKNGFILDHISKPNYWYCYNSKRYHRFGFRKDQLKSKFPDVYDDSLTEFQIMDKTEYRRVWDCGNLVYKMKI